MGNQRRFYINISDQCNLNCTHCFNDGGKTVDRLLSATEIERVVQEAQDSFGIEEVQLTGGEPTRRPDLFSIIDFILKKNLKILLQSNGVFGNNITTEILKLPGQSVSLIFSLDGIETNDYFRGQGSTKKVFTTIETLYKKFSIRLNILLSHKIAWSEIERLAQAALRFDLTLAFNPVCPVGRADASLLMPPTQYFQIMERLESFRAQGIKIRKCFDVKNGQLVENEDCPVRANNTLHVAADGHVYPCGFLSNQPYCYVGTVRDNSLIELLAKIPGGCQILPPGCRECQFYLEGHCHGGCPVRIYALYQRFDTVDFYCMANYYSEERPIQIL